MSSDSSPHVAEADRSEHRLSQSHQTLPEREPTPTTPETAPAPLIQPTALSPLPRPNTPTSSHTTPALLGDTEIPLGTTALGITAPAGALLPSIMTDSIYSYYSDAAEDDYSFLDTLADDDSCYEYQCVQAQTIRFLNPGRPSVVDLMRAERPTFKRASQMAIRRPVERPFLSPIQPPKSYRRSYSPPGESSGSESSSYGSKQAGSSQSSRPSTPTLDDEDGATTPTSEGSPTTPETPKSSFDEERSFSYQDELPTQNILKKHAKSPSRFKLFPKRSTSMNASIEGHAYSEMPPLPHASTEPAAKSTGNMFVPPIPTKNTQARSVFTGRSKFLGLRRMESRVGLNAR